MNCLDDSELLTAMAAELDAAPAADDLAKWLDYRDLPPETTLAALIRYEREAATIQARFEAAREADAGHGWYRLPDEPPASFTELWDVEGVRWERQHPGIDRWVADETAVWHSVRTFAELLARGPLSTTPPAALDDAQLECAQGCDYPITGYHARRGGEVLCRVPTPPAGTEGER